MIRKKRKRTRKIKRKNTKDLRNRLKRSKVPSKKNQLTLKKMCQIKLRLIKLKNHHGIGQDLEALREDIIAETEMRGEEADHQGEKGVGRRHTLCVGLVCVF